MGWDDYDDKNNDPVFGWDYTDNLKSTDVYDNSEEEKPVNDLHLFGHETAGLGSMEEDDRRTAVRDAGTGPGNYDFSAAAPSGSRFVPHSPSTVPHSIVVPHKRLSYVHGKAENRDVIGTLFFLFVILVIICAAGCLAAAIGGGILGITWM